MVFSDFPVDGPDERFEPPAPGGEPGPVPPSDGKGPFPPGSEDIPPPPKDGKRPPGSGFGPPKEDPVPLEDGIAPEEGEAGSLAFSVMHRMGVLDRLERRVFGLIFSSYGLHPSQGVALKTVIRNPGLSQRELADRMRIQRASMTGILQKLERGGFVERSPDPFDQRIYRIYATAKGEEASRLTAEAFEQFFSGCFNGIPPEKQQEIADLLSLCEENILEFEASLHSSDPKESCP